jgi:hypothetical protein
MDMEDARKHEIAQEFSAVGGLVTAYAMKTETPMKEAIKDLRNAGMVSEFDNVLNEGLAFSKIMPDRDGRLVGMSSDAAKRGGTEHVMISPDGVRCMFKDRRHSQQRLAQCDKACRILDQAEARVAKQDGWIPLGLLGPVFERVARTLEEEWEQSGRQDKAAFRSAKVMMTFAVSHAAGYVEVEAYQSAKKMMPFEALKSAARKLTGRADPEQERDFLDMSIWTEPDDPFEAKAARSKPEQPGLSGPT